MNNHIYWPYDEVSLETLNGKVKLKTPWIEASTSQSFFNKSALTTLETKLSDNSLTADDLGLVNNFFQHFREYPLAYILPTHKTAPSLDQHGLVDRSLLDGSLSETLSKIFNAMVPHSSELEENDLVDLLSLFPQRDWTWVSTAALDFSTINKAVHPESLFSIARRYHLLELINTDDGIQIFEDMKALKPEPYKAALCKLVRQNHYVTEKCQEALEPAIALAGQASPLIEEFMAEERGHDKILGKALMHLGADPKTIEVSVQTRMLMHMLKFCAQRNFLAFCMAIDAFERSNYEDTDPMAQLLSKGGFDKAAEFINLHMKINDDGDHENVAAKFLQFMDLCDRDYGFEAIRLMEIVSVLMSLISKSVDNRL